MSNPRFRIIKRGWKVILDLSVKAYEKLIEELEGFDDIRAFDAAKKSGETSVPLEQSIRDIENARR
jgi:hypothetical protein